MTNVQLEAIYKANIDLGHIAALKAVYNHGYYDGAGITVTSQTVDIVPTRTAPTTIIKLKRPD